MDATVNLLLPLLISHCLAAHQDVEHPDVVVVCHADFLPALEPWLDHRRDQGHRIAWIRNEGSAEAIRSRLAPFARGGHLTHVVLVGAAPPLGEPGGADPRSLPVHYRRAQVNVLWGSEPYIATDHGYADLTGDGVPDVAVGRFPAASPEALEAFVAKTLAYESSGDFGPWRRRVNVVATSGEFGRIIDSLIETAARTILTRHVPADYAVSVAYGNWRSPFCPDPRRFHAATLAQLNEGSLFWIYMGHGLPSSLDRLRVGDAAYHVFDASDVRRLAVQSGHPVALLLACYAGALDAADPCLAASMLEAPGGPVAVLAGSRVTMPYGMAVMGVELAEQHFRRQPLTLGETLLAAKRSMLADDPCAAGIRRVLDALANTLSPVPHLVPAERTEHVLLFNLFGDPLLRLPRAEVIEVDPLSPLAGEALRVTGYSPVAGEALVELVVRRDRFVQPPPSRREPPAGAAEMAEMDGIFARSNDRRLAWTAVPIGAGPFAVALDVPRTARGASHVRVFVRGTEGHAMGSAAAIVRRPPQRPADAAGEDRSDAVADHAETGSDP